jgi:competence protein ComEC
MLLCLWALGLAVGLLSGLAVPPDAISASLRGVLLVLGGVLPLVCLRRGNRVLAGLAAVVLVGHGLGWRAVAPLALPPAAARALEAERASEVEGRWVRTLRFAEGDLLPRGLVAVDRIDGAAVSCQLALTVAGTRPVPAPGDWLRFRAPLSLPWGLRNPGLPDGILNARAQGIDLVAFLAPGAEVHVTRGPWWQPRRLADAAHRALARAIDLGISPARGPLLKALVLGERTAAGPEVEAGFKAAGAVHALSVSGLHLTAVAGALFLILRWLLGRVPAVTARVRPAVLAAAAAIPALSFYAAVTGEATATRRAAVMAALGLFAVLVGRTPSLPAAFGASALVLLLQSPLLILDPSFQLSFASVAAVTVAGRGFASTRGRPWWVRTGLWLGRGLWISGAAFIATAPLVSHHFAELAPASPVGNLMLVPVVELGIVPLGLLGAVLGAVWGPAGQLPLWVADGFARVALAIAAVFRAWAPVIPVPSLDGVEALAGLVAAMLALWALRGSSRVRPVALVAALAATIGAAHAGVRAVRRRLDPNVRVTFLDVGQGDAALVEGPGGFVGLIDGGGSLDGAFDPGARVVEPVLRRKLIGRIDLVVLSHPHPDHMNGLFRIVDRFSIGSFWSAGDGAGNPEYERLIALLHARGVAIAEPRALRVGQLTLEPLGPYIDDVIGAPPGLAANDASLVIRLSFAQRQILFTGDIEAQGEAELLGRQTIDVLRSDLLKVPHHGSRTSSSEALLAAVQPRWAVMSLGRRNRFGFPRPEVVRRYQQQGVGIYRTDWDGAIEVVATPAGVLLATCARSCR